jgi:hypothetical protein
LSIGIIILRNRTVETDYMENVQAGHGFSGPATTLITARQRLLPDGGEAAVLLSNCVDFCL